MKRLAAAAQVAVLLGTGYFLVATSQPPCRSEAQTATFRLAGTCGPEVLLTVDADENCAVTTQGSPYLPRLGQMYRGGNPDGGGPTIANGFLIMGEVAVTDAGLAQDGGLPMAFRSCSAGVDPAERLVLSCGTGDPPSCWHAIDGGTVCDQSCSSTLTPEP